MRQTLVTVVAMLAVVAFASMTAADHVGNERDSTFLGSTTVEHDLNEECAETIDDDECVVRIIRGLISVVCDYDEEGHPYTAGLYQGIGGVIFCEVPRDTVATIQYVDVIGPVEPNGFVTCPVTDKDEAVTWHTEFGRLSGTSPVDMTVPDWCDDVGDDDHPDTTNVGVFNLAVSVNDEALGVIVEGGVTLTY